MDCTLKTTPGNQLFSQVTAKQSSMRTSIISTIISSAAIHNSQACEAR